MIWWLKYIVDEGIGATYEEWRRVVVKKINSDNDMVAEVYSR